VVDAYVLGIPGDNNGEGESIIKGSDFVDMVCRKPEILEALSGVSALTQGLDDIDLFEGEEEEEG
jgi:hypothetical protein